MDKGTQELIEVLEFNLHHDAKGRFASGGGGKGVSIDKIENNRLRKFDKQLAKQYTDLSQRRVSIAQYGHSKDLTDIDRKLSTIQGMRNSIARDLKAAKGKKPFDVASALKRL